MFAFFFLKLFVMLAGLHFAMAHFLIIMNDLVHFGSSAFKMSTKLVAIVSQSERANDMQFSKESFSTSCCALSLCFLVL